MSDQLMETSVARYLKWLGLEGSGGLLLGGSGSLGGQMLDPLMEVSIALYLEWLSEVEVCEAWEAWKPGGWEG